MLYEFNPKTDPLFRIVLKQGFDEVRILNNETIQFLINGVVSKECNEFDIYDLNLTIKGGDDYKWLADSDNSADRFSKFLSDLPLKNHN